MQDRENDGPIAGLEYAGLRHFPSSCGSIILYDKNSYQL